MININKKGRYFWLTLYIYIYICYFSYAQIILYVSETKHLNYLQIAEQRWSSYITLYKIYLKHNSTFFSHRLWWDHDDHGQKLSRDRRQLLWYLTKSFPLLQRWRWHQRCRCRLEYGRRGIRRRDGRWNSADMHFGSLPAESTWIVQKFADTHPELSTSFLRKQYLKL